MEDELRRVFKILEDSFTDAIRTAVAVERLTNTVASLNPLVQQLDDLYRHDPELAPEIRAALNHLGELKEALGRAEKFLTARHDEALSRAHAAVGDHAPEGEETTT